MKKPTKAQEAIVAKMKEGSRIVVVGGKGGHYCKCGDLRISKATFRAMRSGGMLYHDRSKSSYGRDEYTISDHFNK